MVDPTTKIFVVLDPSTMEQISLDWAEKIALDLKEHRSLDARLHVYCCVNYKSAMVATNGNSETVKRATTERVGNWMKRLVMHTRELGIPVETEVEWNENWREAIVAATKRQKTNLVVKNLTQHARFVRWVRDTSDWRLLRDCECPVLLVKTGRSYGINRILVAIKHTEDEQYIVANASIVERAQKLADDFGASLHAVTCYGSGNHPDRQRFADSFGLKRSQVSAVMGVPEKVIASVADEVDADLLVIARVARAESSNVLGDMARKVIDEINTDILVLPMVS